MTDHMDEEKPVNGPPPRRRPAIKIDTNELMDVEPIAEHLLGLNDDLPEQMPDSIVDALPPEIKVMRGPQSRPLKRI